MFVPNGAPADIPVKAPDKYTKAYLNTERRIDQNGMFFVCNGWLRGYGALAAGKGAVNYEGGFSQPQIGCRRSFANATFQALGLRTRDLALLILAKGEDTADMPDTSHYSRVKVRSKSLVVYLQRVQLLLAA